MDEFKAKPDADDLGALGKFVVGAAFALLIGFGLFDWFKTHEIDWGQVAAIYLAVGALVGILTALGTFFGLWFWAAQRYETWGFILGWLPSGVAAFVLGWLAVPLYGLAVIVLIIVLVRS